MLTGPIGQIKWAYYVAADVHGYTVTRTRETKQWSFRGVLGASNAYNLTQRPLTFRAPYKQGAWTWPIRTITIVDGVVRGDLGDPVVDDPRATPATILMGV